MNQQYVIQFIKIYNCLIAFSLRTSCQCRVPKKESQPSQSIKLLQFYVLDGSWYLPHQNRNADREYLKEHIPGAIRFDIDENSLKTTNLPHMLPLKEDFEKAVSEMGIENTDALVVYDGMNIFSAARVFWTFRYFGHQNIAVLDGGFPAWKAASGPISDAPPLLKQSKYKANPNTDMVRTLDDILQNVETIKAGKSGAQILDARPHARWLGEAPEPRPIPSGHIPYSKSLPFSELIDQSTGLMKSNEEIVEILKSLKVDTNKQIICSCGSGVTASVIYLALCKIGLKGMGLYDGSWSEYAENQSKVEIWKGTD